MVAIATDTFATRMQPYPSQSHLSRETHLLLKTVSIGPSHMESSTGFSQAPLKQHFPTFHYRTSYFCCFPIFFSLEPSKPPSKDKQDFTWFWDASSQVIFLFQRKFPFLELAPFFPPHSNHPLPLQSYMQFYYRPWSSSLTRIRASTELFIKNFLL